MDWALFTFLEKTKRGKEVTESLYVLADDLQTK